MKQIAISVRRDDRPSIELLEARIAPAFLPVFELSGLIGSNGFQISGETAGDRSGFSVSHAGDINGDSFDDIIIGADLASPNGTASGASYVVFGRNTFSGTIELGGLTGGNGFKIEGETIGDISGRSVSAAGDVNGDGFDDLIIGAPRADANGTDSGAAYVVFGRQTFPATLQLAGLNGATGFKINGQSAGDKFGRSVSAAGDINGDRFDDVIIGAPGADPNDVASGASYVIFGRTTSFPATIEVTSLIGTNGFKINGELRGDHAGRAVSGARDVDRDGFDDLLIGAFRADPNGKQSGASYVIFGGPTFLPVFELAGLTGLNGFQINGEAAGDRSGRAVSAARDLNGDGFADIVIGAPGADPNGESSGASYVVFGRGTTFPATLQLSALNGVIGFKVNGEAAGDQAGHAVGAAGDINGDNISDLIIGAPFADPRGDDSGAAYIVYGKRAPFSSIVELSGLTGGNGFKINGELAGDQAGRAVDTAGDINADGFSDLLIGAPGADPHGSVSGASYVVFGQPSPTTFGLAESSAASGSPALALAAELNASMVQPQPLIPTGPAAWLADMESRDPVARIAALLAS